jgi:hypothetical protein
VSASRICEASLTIDLRCSDRIPTTESFAVPRTSSSARHDDFGSPIVALPVFSNEKVSLAKNTPPGAGGGMWRGSSGSIA